MPICAVCEVKPEVSFFCRKRVRILAPCAALAFIVGTSHHDSAKALLARVGAAAAQFVVVAPSGAWI